jgi:hypothetical protein
MYYIIISYSGVFPILRVYECGDSEAAGTCGYFACGLKLRSKGTLINIVLYIYFDARSLKRSTEVKYLYTYGLPVTNQVRILGMNRPSLF